MAKFDVERFRDYFIALFQSNMAAKIAEINAEKNDGIVLSNFVPDQYTNSLNEKVLNYQEFILYMIPEILTSESVGRFHSETITMSFEAVIVEGADVGNSTETKVMRYTRALAEIINENATERRPEISTLEIQVFAPIPLAIQNGTPVRVGGIQVKGVITG